MPVTEKYPEKSKLGLYKIHDRFFEFWFKYIFPNRGKIEIGKSKEVVRIIKGSFHQHLSYVFEDICKEYCFELMKEGEIKFTSLGRWWQKNEEIDLVALDDEEKNIYFCEAKWSQKPVGTNILRDLQRKTSFVDWQCGKRKEHFILFSKSGFTADLKELSEKERIILVEMQDKHFASHHFLVSE
ncbi:MAG: DUF234 domain-containing protein [Elusimicrobia bacterium]|nr:DUF234 domain-containing protein [Elusimicrobiota bacterium]